MNKIVNVQDHPVKIFINQEYGREPEDLDDLGRCIVAIVSNNKNRKIFADIDAISWEVRFQPRISVSHYCPLLAKTNWHCDDSLPTSYPGFYGRIWLRSLTAEYTNASNLRRLALYAGTGGSGSYGGPWAACEEQIYRLRNLTAKDLKARGRTAIKSVRHSSYDFRFFLQDWPKIEEQIEHEIMTQKLIDLRSSYSKKHSLFWESQRSREFTEEITNLYNTYIVDQDQVV